jgi:type II secretion system protein H
VLTTPRGWHVDRPAGRLCRGQLMRDASGFTLVELMVVMVIAGTLMAIGVFSLANYQKVSQQRGTTKEVVSLLRNASERAISEGRTYCVDFADDGRSAVTYLKTCDGSDPSLRPRTWTQSSKVTLAAVVTSPAPAPPCPDLHQCVYFYPRGTATPTKVVVNSSARDKTYTVKVEGLTARVYSPEL